MQLPAKLSRYAAVATLLLKHRSAVDDHDGERAEQLAKDLEMPRSIRRRISVTACSRISALTASPGASARATVSRFNSVLASSVRSAGGRSPWAPAR